MSSENTLTGRSGEHKVDSSYVARLQNWDVTSKLASTNEWGDSDSAGYTNRSSGRMDATFNTKGTYDTTDEVWDLFEEGDIVVSLLELTALLFWNFPRSICMDFNLVCNIDAEEVVGWTASWGADGQFYKPGQTP